MKVCIKNLGCKVNSYECEFVKQEFIKKGYTIVEEHADVYVINTCTVTNNADNKSKKIIRSIKKNNEDSIIIVMGCFVEYLKEKITDVIDADIIVGNKNKSKIVLYLEEYLKNRKRIIKLYDIQNVCFENMEIEKFKSKTRAFVKIQEGCNNYCSYCIIPFVRGNLRSKKMSMCIEEIENLVKNGHKEVVLTGIHTGHYMDEENTLYDLLAELIKINNLERIRISSIEIIEISENIINLLKTDKIANHFHVPLQSGCDKTLADMNRRYNTSEFLEICNKIRKVSENVSLSTDVIVGFPGESEEDFMTTYNFCKKIEFSKIHVFPYSDRTGTVASKMKNKIENSVKKDRVHRLLKLNDELSKKYLTKQLNNVEKVIIEEYKDNYSIGHTSNFIKVKVSEKLEIGKLYKILLYEILEDNIMLGKSVK